VTSPQRPQDRAPFRIEPAGEGSRSGADADAPPASMSFSSREGSADSAPLSLRADRIPQSIRSSGFGQATAVGFGSSGVPSSRSPQSGVNSGTPPSNPSSHPVSGVRRSTGGIYQAVRLLDKKHGSFFISRLILMTGINLRTFDSSTYDDPVAAQKLVKALRSLLSPVELDGLLPLFSVQR
jgi:hypothetical protein